MSSYKGHLCGGVFAFIVAMAVVIFFVAPTLLAFVEWGAFCLAGSLFPDIDIKSKGQKLFYWLILALVVLLTIQSQWKLLSFISVITITPLLVNHRGIFHQLWFVIAVPCAIAYGIVLLSPGHTKIIVLNTFFFIAGAISHLWLDMGFKRMVYRNVFYR